MWNQITIGRSMKLGLLLYSSVVLAQFTPFIQNFSFTGLGASGQNWDISPSEDGMVYVANGNGLLAYNGLNWQLFPLPNKTTVRSVLSLGNKIYTGSYQEFGFWEKNVFGAYIYHSITDKNSSVRFNNEEFWQIISFQDEIIFRSFYALYICKNNIIQRVVSPSSVISLHIIENQVWVSTLQHGILKLVGNQLVPVLQNQEILNKKILSITELDSQRLFLCTELEGCWVYANEQLQPFDSEINPILKKYQLNRFVKSANGDMFFGTIQNGEYITDTKGKIIAHFNRKNGLGNNTILSQYFDTNKQLWLGLDKGFTVIDLKSNNLYYNDLDGVMGSVYDVIQFQGKTFLGCNTGLYELTQEGNLQFINGTQGHVWDLFVIQNTLFCGHNNGTYIIEGNSAKKISNHAGGWVIKNTPVDSNVFIQGTYGGLVRMENTGSGILVKHLGVPFFPIRYIEFEDSYNAWVAHNNKGLYKITFNSQYDSITKVKEYKSKQWSNYKVRIYKLKNDIIIKTNSGWYRYDPLTDTILPNSYLNKIFGKNTYIASDDNLKYVVLKNNNNVDFRLKKDLSKSLYVTEEYYQDRGLLEDSKVSYFNDSLLSLNLEDGFMLINDRRFNNQSYHLYPPQLNQIEYNNKPISIQKENTYEIPYKHSDLKMRFSSPKSDRYFLEFRMPNQENQPWQKISGSEIEFNHLSSSTNTMAIRASNNLNQHSQPLLLTLEVSPPWYKSKGAFLLYFILILTFFYLFFQLHKNKIDKEQLILRNKLTQEQEEKIKEQQIENEKKLIALKNESLKKEVKHKSKELANNAMALIRKNEALLDIKNALLINKSQLGDTSFIKKIVSKIDHSLGEKKEEWEVFENNFSQIHEDFFETLIQNHPDLNQRDLKLCAYLKMNLLTKEIAPLMNISTRGVETHKYRLKKKLNLKMHQSLSTYLLKIS